MTRRRQLHPINVRHIRALVYLYLEAGHRAPAPALEGAIGRYATNTIQSLETRGLTRHVDDVDGVPGYELTPAGRRVAGALVTSFSRAG